MKAGARECLSLLWRYQRTYGARNVSLRQSRIAVELRRPLRSVQRWIGQLVGLDLVEIQQAGPGAAEYFVKENGGALAELWRSKGRGISITESKENGIQEQHHRDDVALAYESIRKAAGFERLSEGDRRFVAIQRKAGISEEHIVAGIVLGRSRKMTSGAAEPIRSLRYFAATIQEAQTVSTAYIRHCELWIERKAGGR